MIIHILQSNICFGQLELSAALVPDLAIWRHRAAGPTPAPIGGPQLGLRLKISRINPFPPHHQAN